MDWRDQLAKNYRRVDLAEEEFKDLTREIREAVAAERLTLDYEIAPDRLSYSAKLVVGSAPEVDRWAHKAGNIIHNLRSSLDNLIETLGEAPGSQAPSRPNMVHFPVAKTRGEWRDERRRVSHLKALYFNRIRDVQPFNRIEDGKGLQNDGLLLLSVLDNQSKHRLQLEAEIQLSSIDFDFAVKYENDAEASKSVPPDIEIRKVPFKTGEVVMIHRGGGRIERLIGSNKMMFDLCLVHGTETYRLAEIVSNLGQYTRVLMDYVVDGKAS